VFRDLLRQRLPEVPAGKIALLEAHYELLLKWNKVLNLTSIKDLEATVERHYCESIFLGLSLPPNPVSIADIGSGAGFPGIPVAVLRPDCTVTLIESHQRKAVFLREASRKLANVQVLSKRADEVTARFDVAVSRAVSYRDLEQSLHQLASIAILLSGEESPPDSLGFVWSAAIALPWGSHRFLRAGHVSRETSKPNCV
jgi:16S rRNA (guanine(527)-N(7))-methyltransferase RsmG